MGPQEKLQTSLPKVYKGTCGFFLKNEQKIMKKMNQNKIEA